MSENNVTSVSGKVVTVDAPLKIYNEIDNKNKYNPYKINDGSEDKFIKGIPIIFFTTPKLNFTEFNVSKNTFFSYMYHEERSLMNLLNYGESNESNPSTTSPFIKILTNKFGSFSPKDTTARSKEYGETYYGWKQTLPSKIIDSLNGDEFSIKYYETKNLDIIKIHKLWLEYTEYVRRGIITASQETIDKKYIDYLCSVYYFMLDFDGETILYYSRYVGVAPLNIPYSSFDTEINNHDIVEPEINYIYNFKEDMNPAILVDFNKIVAGVGQMYHNFDPNKNSFIPMVSSTKNEKFNPRESYNFSTVKIIKTIDSNNKLKFKLKFN